MRISVVIPSHNRLQSLVPAIESVYAQTSAVDEIILVDDGSTDGTRDEIARLYPAIKLIRQTNLGVSAARNAGIKLASHDWIALLDSDDSWLPEKIASMRQAFASQPDLRIFHSDEIWIRRGIRVNAMKKHAKAGGWIFENCLSLCVISPSAVVVQRSLLQSCGLFDESLPVCEDYDLWLKICHQFPVGYIDKPLITKYGGHADQLSSRYWGMDRFRIRSLQRLLQQDNLRDRDRQAATLTIINKLEVLLKGADKHRNRAVIEEFTPLLMHYRPAQLRDTLSC